MDIQYYISQNIDEQFDVANSINSDIDDLNQQISILESRLQGKRELMASHVSVLLCMVTVNHRRFGGNNHKVPLIKLHR